MDYISNKDRKETICKVIINLRGEIDKYKKKKDIIGQILYYNELGKIVEYVKRNLNINPEYLFKGVQEMNAFIDYILFIETDTNINKLYNFLKLN
jgi:hypothetical protein